MPLRFSLPYKGASDVLLDYSLCQSYVLELWVRRACGNTPRLTCPPLSPWNALLITLHAQTRTWTLSLTSDRGLSLVFGLSGLVNGRANRPTYRAYHHTFSLLFSLIYRLPYSLIFALLITTLEWFNPPFGARGFVVQTAVCVTKTHLANIKKEVDKPMPRYCILWIQ